MTSPNPSNDVPLLKRGMISLTHMKPPFTDYYSFSDSDHLVPPPDAIIVKTPPTKRKNDPSRRNAQPPTDKNTNQGFREVLDSSFRTPVSRKCGMGHRASSTSCDVPDPQTPLPLNGSLNNHLTPGGSCRSGGSLVLLTKKFLKLMEQAEDGILDLKKTAETLEVQKGQKRRIYDITNVLEGIGLIEKLKNGIQWKGPSFSKPSNVDNDIAIVQADIENLSIQERALDEQIRETQERLKEITEDKNHQKWLFVCDEDMKSLPCFENETLIAIKAPHGTTLEVPEPDEPLDCHQKRYRIILRSTMGPIDVYLISQFEEKLEETNGAGTLQSQPSTSECSDLANTVPDDENIRNEIELHGQEDNRISTDASASQDLSGIMKLVPEVYIDTDYWLISDDHVSMTEMWGTESKFDWDVLGSVPEDYVVVDLNTQQPQIPLLSSPGAGEVRSTVVDKTS
ncbi:unnamed protein product [Amaranthus hypochondriacus]